MSRLIRVGFSRRSRADVDFCSLAQTVSGRTLTTAATSAHSLIRRASFSSALCSGCAPADVVLASRTAGRTAPTLLQPSTPVTQTTEASFLMCVILVQRVADIEPADAPLLAVLQLVGQRLSACTCPADADEHPGPSVTKGRGAPESASPSTLPSSKQPRIDAKCSLCATRSRYPRRPDRPERQAGLGVAVDSVCAVRPALPLAERHDRRQPGLEGLGSVHHVAECVSGCPSHRSIRFAVQVADGHHLSCGADIWKGSISQESASLNTLTDATSYEGAGYSTYCSSLALLSCMPLCRTEADLRCPPTAMEYDPGADGRITWGINGNPTWQLNADAMGPNAETQIGQRLVSEEPMYLCVHCASTVQREGGLTSSAVGVQDLQLGDFDKVSLCSLPLRRRLN